MANCSSKRESSELRAEIRSEVVTATLGIEIVMSPLQTRRSRFAPSTSAEVPFVIVVFTHHGRISLVGASERVALTRLIVSPRVASIVESWAVYAPISCQSAFPFARVVLPYLHTRPYIHSKLYSRKN